MSTTKQELERPDMEDICENGRNNDKKKKHVSRERKNVEAMMRDRLLIQTSCFWTLSIVLFLSKTLPCFYLKRLLMLYNSLMNNWEEEEYIEVYTAEARGGIVQ
jgi:hypothetical protein